jgi:hypothetical protein
MSHVRHLALTLCLTVVGLPLTSVALEGIAGASPSTWTVSAAGVPNNPDSHLVSVSCADANDCMAVGDYQAPQVPAQTLTELWDGTTWTILPSPNPTSTSNVWLRSVSCATPTHCVAVGWDEGPGPNTSFIESWNGSTWSIVPNPNPGGYNYLYAVSCITANNCTAVGSTIGDSPLGPNYWQPLIETWDGSQWTVSVSPTLLNTDTFLESVSCTSDGACGAVGYSGIPPSGDPCCSNQTFAEVLSGGTWTITPTPNPSGNQQNILNSVSCSSAMSCMAVGNSLVAATYWQTLTEAWNGSTWSIVPSPNSVGSTNTQLNGVSCVSPSDCTAAGSHESGNNQTLIEAWNGVSWSIVPSPNPVVDSPLFGVSCPDTSDCTAVGSTDTEVGEPDVYALIMSGTTAPPANAPEVPAPLLLPFSALAVGGIGYGMQRRRSRRPTSATSTTHSMLKAELSQAVT